MQMVDVSHTDTSDTSYGDRPVSSFNSVRVLNVAATREIWNAYKVSVRKTHNLVHPGIKHKYKDNIKIYLT
jgi:hypothetical protein